MAEVAVVLKTFMCKRGNRSKTNNGGSDEERGHRTVHVLEDISRNDGWTPTLQRPDEPLQA